MLKTAEPPPDLFSLFQSASIAMRWKRRFDGLRTGSSGDKGVPSGEARESSENQFGGDDSKTDRTCIEKKQRWEAEASEAKV